MAERAATARHAPSAGGCPGCAVVTAAVLHRHRAAAMAFLLLLKENRKKWKNTSSGNKYLIKHRLRVLSESPEQTQ